MVVLKDRKESEDKDMKKKNMALLLAVALAAGVVVSPVRMENVEADTGSWDWDHGIYYITAMKRR